MQRWKNTAVNKMSLKFLLNNAGTYIVLILAVGGLTFFGIFPGQTERGGLGGLAARVGDVRITNSEFRTSYRSAHESYSNQFGQDFDPIKANLSETVVQQLVNKAVVFVVASDLGLRASEEEVISYLTEANAFTDKDGNFSEQFFTNFLRSNRFSEEEFVESLQRDLTLDKLRGFTNNYVMSSKLERKMNYRLANSHIDIEYIKFSANKLPITVTAEEINSFASTKEGQDEIKDYYEKNRGTYNQEEQVKAQHILIAYKGARSATTSRSKEAANKLAKQVLAAAQANPDFNSLVQKHTDEPQGKKNNGDLGFFNRADMAKPFSDAAFSADKGKIYSSVVETPFGFHIIKVLDKKAEVNKTMTDAQEEIATILLKQQKAPQYVENLRTELLTKLKSSENIDSLLAEHDLKRETTGKFSLSARFVPKLGNDAELLEQITSLTSDFIPYESNNTQYLLRISSQTKANMQEFKDNDATNIYLRYFLSNQMYERLTQEARDRLKDRIWINPDYLYFDRNRAAQQSTQQSSS